jgi:hypothetical protein
MWFGFTAEPLRTQRLNIFPLAAETPARGKNQGPSGPLLDTKNVMLRLKF